MHFTIHNLRFMVELPPALTCHLPLYRLRYRKEGGIIGSLSEGAVAVSFADGRLGECLILIFD